MQVGAMPQRTNGYISCDSGWHRSAGDVPALRIPCCSVLVVPGVAVVVPVVVVVVARGRRRYEDEVIVDAREPDVSLQHFHDDVLGGVDGERCRGRAAVVEVDGHVDALGGAADHDVVDPVDLIECQFECRREVGTLGSRGVHADIGALQGVASQLTGGESLRRSQRQWLREHDAHRCRRHGLVEGQRHEALLSLEDVDVAIALGVLRRERRDVGLGHGQDQVERCVAEDAGVGDLYDDLGLTVVEVRLDGDVVDPVGVYSCQRLLEPSTKPCEQLVEALQVRRDEAQMDHVVGVERRVADDDDRVTEVGFQAGQDALAEDSAHRSLR